MTTFTINLFTKIKYTNNPWRTLNKSVISHSQYWPIKSEENSSRIQDTPMTQKSFQIILSRWSSCTVPSLAFRRCISVLTRLMWDAVRAKNTRFDEKISPIGKRKRSLCTSPSWPERNGIYISLINQVKNVSLWTHLQTNNCQEQSPNPPIGTWWSFELSPWGWKGHPSHTRNREGTPSSALS